MGALIFLDFKNLQGKEVHRHPLEEYEAEKISENTELNKFNILNSRSQVDHQ